MTNVVAIEGAGHGILANSVLPIGYSRMVSESIGERTLSDLEDAFFKSIEPERVVPLVLFLASRACDVTHQNISAAAGRYARAFMGLSEGWLADPQGPAPTAEEIAAHYDEISATERFTVPMSASEEIVGRAGGSASSERHDDVVRGRAPEPTSGPGWPRRGTPRSPFVSGGRGWRTAAGGTRTGRPSGSARAMTPRQTTVVREELAAARVLGPPIAVGTSMGAPVLLAHGTDEQRSRWLPALARGEELWCQFFSEPGAGSDLASVQTKAVRDGDDWVVNGQKVWNSSTILADRGILVARTDPDVPKHRGLSFFVIDVDQPGVEIRPIRQMNERTEFNETFFTDARVQRRRDDRWAGRRLAGRDDDARQRASRLRRRLGAPVGDRRRRRAGGSSRPPRAATSSRTRAATTSASRTRRRSTRRSSVIALAREWGRADDPITRQRLARVYAMSEALRWTGERAEAAATAGRQPGAESSVGYVGGVRLLRLDPRPRGGDHRSGRPPHRSRRAAATVTSR